jgi:hypothetical protein
MKSKMPNSTVAEDFIERLHAAGRDVRLGLSDEPSSGKSGSKVLLIKESVQKDGRIRRWTRVAEMDGKYLRVILLPDRETVHNAFFDRSFKP